MWKTLWRIPSRDWRLTITLVVALELAGVLYSAWVHHVAAPGTVFGPQGIGTTFSVGPADLRWTAFDLFCWWRVYRGGRAWLWVQRAITVFGIAGLVAIGPFPVPGIGLRDSCLLVSLVVLLGTSAALTFSPSLDRHVTRPGAAPSGQVGEQLG